MNLVVLTESKRVYVKFCMPLVKIQYSKKININSFESLSNELSSKIASLLGKSIDFVMIIFEASDFQYFGGDAEKASLYIEVKNVGTISPETSNEITSFLTNTLNFNCEVESSRIYIEFSDSERHMWGWDGKTFAH